MPPVPKNEVERLEALRQYLLLDTPQEQVFDDITRLASLICGAPIAIMTLVDSDRQWFKSKVGLEPNQTSREHAFCAYTILKPGLMVVNDAWADPRFASNPLVTGEPHIRFYAGAPLLTREGHGLGSLCVIDREPRELTTVQTMAMEALARLVMHELDLRRVSSQLADAVSSIKTLSGLVPICGYCKGIRDDKGYWQQLEAYVSDHSYASFSHGICPVCAKKHFPDIDLLH